MEETNGRHKKNKLYSKLKYTGMLILDDNLPMIILI